MHLEDTRRSAVVIYYIQTALSKEFKASKAVNVHADHYMNFQL